MNEDFKRVKAVLPEKVILLGMSRTRPEQLASYSGPLVAADVLVREGPDNEEEEEKDDEEDEDDEEEDDEEEDEGWDEDDDDDDEDEEEEEE
jgi:hypothetical protein